MTDKPILIAGGRVVDPSRGVDQVLDVLMKDGVIARVGERIAAPKGADVFYAEGLVVAPGFVDLHVHFREPGFEHKVLGNLIANFVATILAITLQLLSILDAPGTIAG